MKLNVAAMAALAGITMATAGYASASALTVDGGILQYGEDNVLVCDDDSLTVSWIVDTSKAASVQGIRVNGVNGAACQGATLAVRIPNIGEQTWVVADGQSSYEWRFEGDPSNINSVKTWIYS